MALLLLCLQSMCTHDVRWNCSLGCAYQMHSSCTDHMSQPLVFPHCQNNRNLQPTGYDQFGNPIYQQQQMYPYQQQEAMNQQPPHQQQLPLSNSIGSLPPPNMNPNSSTASLSNQMIKTDSHAVLMELFARDQYLVRQAASSKSSPNPAQNPNGDQVRFNIPPPATSAAAMPMQKQHSVTFDRVPTLSSWPHFSSVSSLNNLGGIQGVKSITNLSAADLSSQGNLNKMGNLAQVKSIENMVCRGCFMWT